MKLIVSTLGLLFILCSDIVISTSNKIHSYNRRQGTLLPSKAETKDIGEPEDILSSTSPEFLWGMDSKEKPKLESIPVEQANLANEKIHISFGLIKENLPDFLFGFFSVWFNVADGIRDILKKKAMEEALVKQGLKYSDVCSLANLKIKFEFALKEKISKLNGAFEEVAKFADMTPDQRQETCSLIQAQKKAAADQLKSQVPDISFFKKLHLTIFKPKTPKEKEKEYLQAQQILKKFKKENQGILKAKCKKFKKTKKAKLDIGLIKKAFLLGGFLSDTLKCVQNSDTGVLSSLSTTITYDITRWALQPLHAVVQVFTLGLWGIAKAIFYFGMMIYYIYKMHKVLKRNPPNMKNFAYYAGKVLGSIIKVIVGAITGMTFRKLK
jgi:hypothetical protein